MKEVAYTSGSMGGGVATRPWLVRKMPETTRPPNGGLVVQANSVRKLEAGRRMMWATGGQKRLSGNTAGLSSLLHASHGGLGTAIGHLRLTSLPMHDDFGVAAMLAHLMFTLGKTAADIEASRSFILCIYLQIEALILFFEVLKQLATQPL